MRRFLLIFLMFYTCAVCAAQVGKMSHSFQVAGGVYYETGESGYEPGPGFRIAYALDIPLFGHWSIQPSVGLRGQRSHFRWLFQHVDGGCVHAMAIGEFYCAVKYGVRVGANHIELGLAPGLDYHLTHQKYGFNPPPLPGDPAEEVCGEPIFKDYNIGLRPSLLYRIGKHWSCGVESTIGLLQSKVQYPDYPVGETHLITVMAVCSCVF